MTGLRTALALFTVLPVRGPQPVTRTSAVAALRWLPLVGAGLGALAGLPMTAVLRWAPHASLLGAVLATALLVLLTRALHLDGLADTTDGLGAHVDRDRALEIMRRSDIGPFGVIAVVLVLLVDGTALASLPGGVWVPVAALAVAAATGRCGVLLAAARSVPAARTDGFGAFVAASTSAPLAVAELLAVGGLGAGLAVAVGVSWYAWPVAQAAALLVSVVLRVHTTRRFGGVTGDVFGALIELGTAATLAGLALAG